MISDVRQTGARRQATGEEAREREDQRNLPQSPLAELQRSAGNAAVARLIQRKDAPASTDAPGAHAGGGKKPAEKQKPAEDVHARVLKFEVDGDGLALVTLSAGSAQGVADGMPGSMLGESGKEYADFTTEGTAGATCKARFRATQDMVSRGPNAVIKASQYKPPESQAGKEF
jgi:hypothetical protein